MPSDFIVRLFINFILVIMFFTVNVGLIRLIMKHILKISKNRKAESWQVAFWVTLAAFVFSFYMHVPLVRWGSALIINLLFVVGVQYYYFLDAKKTLYSWLLWIGFYVVFGVLLSLALI